jgi:hypothetical protein
VPQYFFDRKRRNVGKAKQRAYVKSSPGDMQAAAEAGKQIWRELGLQDAEEMSAPLVVAA